MTQEGKQENFIKVHNSRGALREIIFRLYRRWNFVLTTMTFLRMECAYSSGKFFFEELTLKNYDLNQDQKLGPVLVLIQDQM